MMDKKNKIKKNAITLFKGTVIGGTMLVPGVSGGSMAIILGIYDELIKAVSTIRKNFKRNLLFLMIFVLGAGAGMLLFARPLLALITRFNRPMLYFFMGAVVGGVPLMCRESGIKRLSWKHPIYVALGVAIVLLLTLLPTDLFDASGTQGIVRILLLCLTGIIAAVALILPGISVSYMFLVLGLYDSIVEAISTFDILFLMPLGIGLILGVFLTAKSLDYLMKRFTGATYMVILGFIVGSVADVFPGLPVGLEWIWCILLAVAGFFVIHFISKLEASAG